MPNMAVVVVEAAALGTFARTQRSYEKGNQALQVEAWNARYVQMWAYEQT